MKDRSEELYLELKKWLSEKKEKRIVQDSSKIVQKDSSNLNYYVLKIIAEDQKLDRIFKEKNWSKSRLSYYLKPLKEAGLILMVGKGTWELTQKGSLYLHKFDKDFSIRKTPLHRFVSSGTSEGLLDVHVHNLRVKFDLIKDDSKSEFWNKMTELAYSRKYYHYDTDFTIEKTSKSVLVLIDIKLSIDDPKLLDDKFIAGIYDKINKAVSLIEGNGIEIDRSKPMDSYVEFAYQTPMTRAYSRLLKLESSPIIYLGRLREKIFKEGSEQEAKAWISMSHPESWQSTDYLLGERLLKMPDNIQETVRLLQGSLSTQQALANQQLLNISNQRSMIDLLSKMEKSLTEIRREFTVERVLKKPSEDSEILECPICHASFSKKLLLFLQLLCPSCHSNLEGWYKSRHDKE